MDAASRQEIESLRKLKVELFGARTVADQLHEIAHVVRHHDLHGFWEDRPRHHCGMSQMRNSKLVRAACTFPALRPVVRGKVWSRPAPPHRLSGYARAFLEAPSRCKDAVGEVAAKVSQDIRGGDGTPDFLRAATAAGSDRSRVGSD